MPEKPKSFARRSSSRLTKDVVSEVAATEVLSTTTGPALRSSMKSKDSKAAGDGQERSVSFSKLEIREFLIMLGDNPTCEGAPVCISDRCQKQQVIDVDEFEINRKERRKRKELVLSATRRSRLLLQLGYTMEDVASAALETQKARQERQLSLGSKKWDSFNFVAESARRKLNKIVGKNKPEPERESYASRSA